MRESLAEGRIKGGIVRSRLDWLREHHGPAGLEQVLARVPPNLAQVIRGALATSWVPFAALVRLDEAIVATFGQNRPDLLRELGRYSAQQNLSTTYRLFKRSDIHEFFRRSAALHAQFQDFGFEEYTAVGDHAGQIRHRDYTSFSGVYCESACGYYEQAMRMHGAEAATVTHSACISRGAEECVFDLRWR